MPRSGHWQRAAISAAVDGVPPMAVKSPRSTAAFNAAVRWNALIVSKKSCGEGAGVGCCMGSGFFYEARFQADGNAVRVSIGDSILLFKIAADSAARRGVEIFISQNFAPTAKGQGAPALHDFLMPLIDRLFSIGSIRKAIWRMWYPFLTRRLRGDGVLFLNYAFESEPPVGLPLSPEDEPNRACIQLYHHVASQVDLRGADVLEVSCGHGGGASWIARTMQPASYTGLDLNPTGIAFCRERHRVAGLSFLQGDAQRLPFADGSLDAVINVEASHCYPDFPGFLAEVARVLRPDGHFLYADFRFSDLFAAWDAAIAESAARAAEAEVTATPL